MSDPDLILNPKTNRYVKKTSQTGRRLLKELATPPPVPSPTHVEARVEPVQQALVETCAELVVEHAPKFKNLTAAETDDLFKRLLFERLSIAPSKPKKKASKYRVVESSDSESD